MVAKAAGRHHLPDQTGTAVGAETVPLGRPVAEVNRNVYAPLRRVRHALEPKIRRHFTEPDIMAQRAILTNGSKRARCASRDCRTGMLELTYHFRQSGVELGSTSTH
jgi:hypothetical protein